MDAPQYEVKNTSSHRSNDSRSSKKGATRMLQAPKSLVMSLDFFLLDVLHLDESIHLAF
jgi:hypothetical protein